MKKLLQFIGPVLFLLLVSASLNATNVDSLLRVVKNTESDSARINNYYKLAKAYKYSDLAQSITYADSGINISKQLNDSLNIGIGYLLSGSSYSQLGLYKNAINRLNKAKEIFLQYNDTSQIIETIIKTGNVFWFQSDYKMALKIYMQAATLSKQFNNYKHQAISMNMAICYSHLDQLDSSIVIFNRILKPTSKTQDEYLKALTFLNIGTIYLNNNYIDSSSIYLKKAQQHEYALSDIVKTNLMGSFVKYYSITNQPALSMLYLDSCFSYAQSVNSLLALKEYFSSKFEMDTTFKNYNKAIYSQLELNKINDSLNNADQRRLLTNYKALYDLKIKEQEIKNLKVENNFIKLKEKKRFGLIALLSLIITLCITILIIYLRLNKIKTNSISNLHQLNSKLEAQQNELESNNEELMQIIEKLHETQEQLIQSEKLASIGILAAGVAHEINNPLNFVNGGSLLLKEIKPHIEQHDELKEKFSLALNMIDEGTLKANKVVKTLGKFAFKKDSRLKKEDINSIVESALSKIKFKLSPDINISKALSETPLLFCDKSKVETVAVQLLINAIDAVSLAENDKQIEIKTFITSKDNIEFIAFSISNNGQPIEYSHIGKLFDPFFTTKDPNKGYGLGLSIAYNLVKELNGEIMVQTKDELVEFVVLLPVEQKTNSKS